MIAVWVCNNLAIRFPFISKSQWCSLCFGCASFNSLFLDMVFSVGFYVTGTLVVSKHTILLGLLMKIICHSNWCSLWRSFYTSVGIDLDCECFPSSTTCYRFWIFLRPFRKRTDWIGTDRIGYGRIQFVETVTCFFHVTTKTDLSVTFLIRWSHVRLHILRLQRFYREACTRGPEGRCRLSTSWSRRPLRSWWSHKPVSVSLGRLYQ